jgi:hypothetical protein
MDRSAARDASTVLNETALGRLMLYAIRQRYHFGDRPDTRTRTSFHRRSTAQRLINSAKVVVHVKQCDHRDAIINLRWSAYKAEHVHPHIKIFTFKIS